jgi:hypothetical protein
MKRWGIFVVLVAASVMLAGCDPASPSGLESRPPSASSEPSTSAPGTASPVDSLTLDEWQQAAQLNLSSAVRAINRHVEEHDGRLPIVGIEQGLVRVGAQMFGYPVPGATLVVGGIGAGSCSEYMADVETPQGPETVVANFVFDAETAEAGPCPSGEEALEPVVFPSVVVPGPYLPSKVPAVVGTCFVEGTILEPSLGEEVDALIVGKCGSEPDQWRIYGGGTLADESLAGADLPDGGEALCGEAWRAASQDGATETSYSIPNAYEWSQFYRDYLCVAR